MKKAFAAVIAVVSALGVMLSGCSIEFRSIDSLMRPPHTATEAELKKSISDLIGDEISYRSPESGENHSAITIRDINKDNTEEAIVFYSKNDDSSNVRMCVLTKSGENWLLVSDFAGNGSGVLTVDFDDLNNDKDEEILVTWFMFDDKSQKKLSVYAADTKNSEMSITTCISEPYNIMTVADVCGKGDRQILVAYSNTAKETDRTTLKLIGVSEGNDILMLNETVLDNRIISLSSISFDFPAGNATPRLYVDAQISDDQSITQVIEWSEEQRNFISLIDDVKNPDLTLRGSNFLCKDIDEDGILEIPLQKPLSESVNGDTLLGYLLVWSEVRNGNLVAQEHYVVNLLENYTLFYPDEWKDGVFVRSDITARIWNFVDSDENVLFSISACKLEDRDDYTSDITKRLTIQDETVYFCTITSYGEDYGITFADIQQYFSVNINF